VRTSHSRCNKKFLAVSAAWLGRGPLLAFAALCPPCANKVSLCYRPRLATQARASCPSLTRADLGCYGFSLVDRGARAHRAAERIAASRSAQRSSASSIPTLSRRSEGGRCPCPGTAARRSIVDSTAPRLVAWRMSLTFRQTPSATSAPPRRSNEMMVPKPLSTRLVVACVGWEGKPG
jgi:hypothetical protein